MEGKVGKDQKGRESKEKAKGMAPGEVYVGYREEFLHGKGCQAWKFPMFNPLDKEC